MVFQDVDLLEELKRKRESEPVDLADFAQQVWEEDVQAEEATSDRLKSGVIGEELRAAELLNEDLIFHEQTIARICTTYRLRFLESKRFRGDLPYEAIRMAKEFEDKHGVAKFKIVAPAERFQLKDSTKDPILMADLGDGRYYFIHKWGNDMSWSRKLLSFPFRNITTLSITSAILGLMLTMFLPLEHMITSTYAPQLVMLQVFTFSVASAFFFTVSLIVGITSSKDFSENVWDSPYFN